MGHSYVQNLLKKINWVVWYLRCDMTFIEPMQPYEPNITYSYVWYLMKF